MINLQDYIRGSNLFMKYQTDDFMLVKYRCRVADNASDIWAHQDYLAYVLGGQKKWVTPANASLVGPGEVLYVRKGATTLYQYFKRPFDVIFLFISEDFIAGILRNQPRLVTDFQQEYLNNDKLVPVTLNPVLLSGFEVLNSCFSKNVKLNELALKLKIESLLIDLLLQPGNLVLKKHFSNVMAGAGVAIQEVMQANFMKPLEIESFARLCGRSLSSFRRDFRKQFGTTPGKWLLEKRLEHSRFLLETTEDRISEVLYASGFTNRAHFNKAFKNAFGLPPKEHREEVATY
jgi:AraC-like DNA-binding protein